MKNFKEIRDNRLLSKNVVNRFKTGGLILKLQGGDSLTVGLEFDDDMDKLFGDSTRVVSPDSTTVTQRPDSIMVTQRPDSTVISPDNTIAEGLRNHHRLYYDLMTGRPKLTVESPRQGYNRISRYGKLSYDYLHSGNGLSRNFTVKGLSNYFPSLFDKLGRVIGYRQTTNSPTVLPSLEPATKNITVSSPSLQSAVDKKEQIRQVQQMLIKKGYGSMLGKYGADGIWGKNTQRAWNAYKAGLKADKIAKLEYYTDNPNLDNLSPIESERYYDNLDEDEFLLRKVMR